MKFMKVACFIIAFIFALSAIWSINEEESGKCIFTAFLFLMSSVGFYINE